MKIKNLFLKLNSYCYWPKVVSIIVVLGMLPNFGKGQTIFGFKNTASGPSGSGSSTSNMVYTFDKTATTQVTPLLTATFSLSNQQFSSTEGNPTVPGTSFGTSVTSGTAISANTAPSYIFNSTLGAFDGTTNVSSLFTGCNTCTPGTGIVAHSTNTSSNRALEILNSVDALIDATGQSTHALNDRILFSDITITFNRPVKNPIIHFGDIGGRFFYGSTIGGVTTYYYQGFATDFDLITPGLSITKLSGNSVFTVTSTSVKNTAPNLGTPSSGFTEVGVLRQAAAGSVVVNGNNVTTVTFRMYIRGDGGTVRNAAGTVVAANNGNQLQWSSQLNHLVGGTGTYVRAFSGDGFFMSISLDECSAMSAGDDVNVACSGTNLPSSIQLTGSPSGGTWSNLPTNPTGATVNSSGLVTFTNPDGQGKNFDFIYTFGTCTDTVKVIAATCNANCTAPNAGTDVTICLPKTITNLADAPIGYEWVVGNGNPTTATISATTGIVTGLTAVGTYKFRLQKMGEATCYDEIQIIVTNGEAPITLCSDGSTSYSLIAPANLSNVIWYNMASQQVGTGNTLVVTSNTNGLSDGIESYYYVGIDGSLGGCDVELCCPIKFITQNCCPRPNCGTITVIKN